MRFFPVHGFEARVQVMDPLNLSSSDNFECTETTESATGWPEVNTFLDPQQKVEGTLGSSHKLGKGFQLYF